MTGDVPFYFLLEIIQSFNCLCDAVDGVSNKTPDLHLISALTNHAEVYFFRAFNAVLILCMCDNHFVLLEHCF